MSGPQMRETDRRKLNVIEGLILFVMTSLLGGVLWLSKSTIELVSAVQFLRDDVQSMKAGNAGIPERVSRLEVRMDAVEERAKEQRQMRGLK